MPATNAASDLATHIAAALAAQSIPVIGSRGTPDMLVLTLTADAARAAVAVLTTELLDRVNGVHLDLEIWSAERAAVYARNVPAEAGAQARIRLTF